MLLGKVDQNFKDVWATINDLHSAGGAPVAVKSGVSDLEVQNL